MLSPNFQEQQAAFGAKFSGMTCYLFSYDDFETTCKQLVKEIHHSLRNAGRRLLVSFKAGASHWELYPLEGAVRYVLRAIKITEY